jgi:hypothetical protein
LGGFAQGLEAVSGRTDKIHFKASSVRHSSISLVESESADLIGRVLSEYAFLARFNRKLEAGSDSSKI